MKTIQELLDIANEYPPNGKTFDVITDLCDRLKVATDALAFYAYPGNYKLWNGEIILGDKGNQAREALERIK